MCDSCGRYKGRVVVDVAAREAKRAERIARKKRSYGEEVPTEGHTETEEGDSVKAAEEPKKSKKKTTPKAKGANTETKKEDR